MNTPEPGRVFWVTGLSGSGKTTIATLLADALRAQGKTAILLDGDELREVFGGTQSYDEAARRDASMRYARLCRLLAAQGANVICATISMFDATRAWNREHIAGYYEIYVRVPLEELKRRDSKGIYSRGEQVVGVDIAFEAPKTPDITVDNHGATTPKQALVQILQHIK
jgi:adenylylsulfate kinase